MGNRDDADTRDNDLNAGEDSNLLRADPDVIHRVDHDPGEWDSLAKTDQDVAEQQTLKGLAERPETLLKIPAIDRSRLDRGRFAQLQLDQKSSRGKRDRNGQANPDAVHDAEVVNQISAQYRGDHDRDALDDRLHANAHRMPICTERRTDQGEAGRQ